MADPARKRMTVEEFLDWDDGTDRRYELFSGEIVAMAPPSIPHAAIAGNMAVALGSRLKKPCRPFVEAGIVRADRKDSYYQADLAVSCVPQATRPPLREPQLIVEVLSPSTERDDRGVKLPGYRTLASVTEIILISSTRREIEHWARSGQTWTVTTIVSGPLILSSFGIEIGLDEIYDGTGIEEAA